MHGNYLALKQQTPDLLFHKVQTADKSYVCREKTKNAVQTSKTLKAVMTRQHQSTEKSNAKDCRNLKISSQDQVLPAPNQSHNIEELFSEEIDTGIVNIWIIKRFLTLYDIDQKETDPGNTASH